jgi:hypothetical protein
MLCLVAALLLAPLATTVAAQTQPPAEIVDFAATLSDDPVKIFEYVRNNIKYVPYVEKLKGSVATLLDQSGNDCDQAYLLRDL